MQEVCREGRRKFIWFHSQVEDLYVRKDVNGNFNAKIFGDQLPNPDDIFKSRTSAVSRGVLPLGSRLHADPVTKKLWEHKNAQFNA